MDYQTSYAAYLAAIEAYLAELFTAQQPYGKLYESMRYSVLAGGKRIRPVLTLEFARLGGIDWHLALPYACALELVHNYSLIHDDLPCMDNDDLRRGKPTNHKVFGETMAILAGDALQPEAFGLIASAQLSAESRIDAVQVLAKAAGADGMVGGQVLDTVCRVDTEEALTLLHRLKTGAMIAGAAELGCVAAEMSAEKRAQAVEFAAQLGLAFQIRDDMLDVIGTAEEMGKSVGTDAVKNTFVQLYGLETCDQLVCKHTKQAITNLEKFKETQYMEFLANSLTSRTV
jgi:geranylgeranyl diphosphate synthase type II